VRLDVDQILLTPSGACKGDLAPRDLLITDLSGEVICGNGCPSSELQMHLLYYHSRPDVWAVCHGHPPTATGFAVAGRALEEAILPEVVISLGKVPLAPYGTPGTWELRAGLEPLVSKHDAILMQNHGVVTSGKELATAYYHMETVEQFARVCCPRAGAEADRGKITLWCVEPEDSLELPLTAESLDESVTLKRRELESFLEESLRKYRFRGSRNDA
jgi:L-fuculose-phosphate aldolase